MVASGAQNRGLTAESVWWQRSNATNSCAVANSLDKRAVFRDWALGRNEANAALFRLAFCKATKHCKRTLGVSSRRTPRKAMATESPRCGHPCETSPRWRSELLAA